MFKCGVFIMILINAFIIFKPPTYGLPEEERPPAAKKCVTALKSIALILFISVTRLMIVGSDWHEATFTLVRKYAIPVLAVFGILLFVCAMQKELKNRGNQYSIKTRFAKYAFQELSFVLLSCSAFLFSVAYIVPVPAEVPEGYAVAEFISIPVVVISIILHVLISKKLGSFAFYLYGYFTAQELKQNSKQMKALRNSARQ